MNALRPIPIVSVERGYAFFWCAKSGCTSVGRAVLADLGAFERYAEAAPRGRGPDEPEYIDAVRSAFIREQGITARNALELIVRHDLATFKVVRNPLTRSVSAFAMLMRGDLAGNADRSGIRTALVERFGVPRASEISFAQFVQWLSELDLDRANIHVRPQFLAAERDRPGLIETVVHLERLAEELPPVGERLGADFSRFLDLRGRHATPVSGRTGRDVAAEPFRNYADAIPPYECFLRPEIRQRLGQLYADDFARYGYSPDAAVER